MNEWIIPCNLKYYDIYKAFKELDYIDWIQNAKNIEIGNIVYIYVGNPKSKIEFKCIVTKKNMSTYEIDDTQYFKDEKFFQEHQGKIFMRLKLVCKLPENIGSIKELKSLGLNGNIQSQRTVPNKAISNYLGQI